MIKDINGTIIEIGDIVKIENSPIKSDNAIYVVVQDGTSKNYSSTELTMYKVAKHKGGYSLSKTSYNIAFYPLTNFSSKYHYTREEMNNATIEILLKSNSNVFNLVKSNDNYEAEETEQTYFRAVVKDGEKEIEDISYSASQKEKMCAFFSNITLKQGEIIEIIKQDHTWGYYYKNVAYKLENVKPVEEVKPETETIAEVTKEATKEPEQTEIKAEVETESTIEVVEESQLQKEVLEIERKYFPINERLARDSKSMWSFSDYVPNSETQAYKTEVNKVYAIADKIAECKPERLNDALSLAEKFSRKYAEWINKGLSIEMQCPSVMICGGSNFPTRKKEKQNASRDRHMQDLQYINGYIAKIENILYGKEIIKSGDTDAIEKLQTKLTELEESQKFMKDLNSYYRKNNTCKGFQDFTEEKAQKYDDAVSKDWRNIPFPSYHLTNNNAKIKATKDRIESLQKAKAIPMQESETMKCSVCQVVENTEIMRIQLIFDGKPNEETRTILKSNGFKWAPSQKAWQRQLTSNAKYSTKKVIEQLESLTA